MTETALDNPVRRDLVRHMQEEIGALCERHLRLAQEVLPQSQVLLMFVEASVSLGLSAASTCAVAVEPDKAPGVYDSTVDLIAKGLLSRRDLALSKVNEARMTAA